MNHPPKCSKEWTQDERLALIQWISGITLERIRRDDGSIPILAKRPVRELFETINLIATASPEWLETNARTALEKPYDETKNYPSVIIL